MFTDGCELRRDPDPAYMGYSMGRWDGDTFVVETAGFHEKNWIDSAGMPGSDALHVTERFHRKDFGHTEVAITINDPRSYAKPWTVRLPLSPVPVEAFVEDVCNENITYRAAI